MKWSKAFGFRSCGTGSNPVGSSDASVKAYTVVFIALGSSTCLNLNVEYRGKSARLTQKAWAHMTERPFSPESVAWLKQGLTATTNCNV